VHQSEIIDFHVSGSTLDTLKIVTAHRDDSFYIHQFPVISAKLQISGSISWISLLKFAAHEISSFAFVPMASNSAHFYDFQRRTIISPTQTEIQLTEISLLSVGSRAVVSASTDGTIYAWTYTMRQTGILFVHRSPIVAMYLSDEFSVLASADSSGQIAISLLPSLLSVNTIDGGVPLTHLLVSEKHGYLLAFDGNRCRNFTLNATAIKERVFDAVVRSVCNAQQLFATITDDNELALYDVHTLAKLRVVYQYQNGLSAVRFHRSLNALVCVRGDFSIGLAFLTP
jgi:WD40 repeat protein